MTSQFVKQLIDTASAPYRAAGKFAWHFARGKLGGDPVFVGLLEHGLIGERSRILDIGCGQGLLASWLLSAKAAHEKGQWPAHWPAAPSAVSIHGIELMPRDVARAQRALGNAARFTAGDMCSTDFGKADTVVILDVLHYVSIEAQDDVLRRVRDALAPRGRLVLRVGDAAAGLPFLASVWVDRIVTFVRGHRNSRMYCRPLADWKTALEKLGFRVRSLPMNKGTPFANILLVADLGD
ncbi:class I SAM-dependent methyltransferase [Noviherbaspirillum aridicola]|uniref:Methyltransferase n=1 Tax=Noviherbaspirillum aridicola TaxID=2849687 RepID=A0ABQ4Q686_9BURK|nr:class I SAM-dependent methyltransferase [Noviherbaspirillum aridicola]GIZ52554.1 methyltransferase [Noviherbaspirillum aridicola]